MRRVVQGIHRVKRKTRDGLVEHHYAWRGGPRFWCSRDACAIGTPSYWALYDAVAEQTPRPGRSDLSVRDILRAFLQSGKYRALSARSRKDYQRGIFHDLGLDPAFGDIRAIDVEDEGFRQAALAWRARIASDRTADLWMGHFGAILNWAIDEGHIRRHSLANMEKRYRPRTRTEGFWMEEDIRGYIEHAPDWVSRIVVAACETGLRPGDLCELGPSHVRADHAGRPHVVKPTRKSGYKTVTTVPVTPRMQALIDATPAGQATFLLRPGGKPWTPEQAGELNKALKRYRPEGVNDRLNLYDIRVTAATRLLVGGSTIAEIATCMGWQTSYAQRTIEHYLDRNPGLRRTLHERQTLAPQSGDPAAGP